MNRILLLVFLGYLNPLFAQQKPTLTVEKIMRDPRWMGTSPEEIVWGAFDGRLYFRWNPEGKEYASLYGVSSQEQTPRRLEERDVQQLISEVRYSNDGKQAVYVKNGGLFLRNVKSKQEKQLTATTERISNARFNADATAIIFRKGDNLYAVSPINGALKQLTNFTKEPSKKVGQKLSVQNEWLKNDQGRLFEVLKDRKRQKVVADSLEKLQAGKPLKELSIEENEILRAVDAGNEQFITYLTYHPSKDNKNTIIPNFVTESGYTENINGRTKVGELQGTTKAFLYKVLEDTVLAVSTSTLEGIKDIPTFYNDYPTQRDSLIQLNADRPVNVAGIYWNTNGTRAIATIYAQDHKDRWIASLNLQTGALETLDRQHDDAWIAGPGIGGWGGGNVGWLDDDRFYFQSEASGYSHLYTLNTATREKKQLTSGKYEVQDVILSKDKKNFYITANKEHPGMTHFYKLPVNGGTLEQISSLKGGNEVTLSPDEQWLAIRYSNSNTPWELYLQENKPGAKAVQITDSRTDEFKAYSWREPSVISFANRYGDSVYARIYTPEQAKAGKPAVIFVHGAGYLQNVHYWWSSYSREYMFHNLLADLGYTVLDIDYTASAGYGRDHRTGIYRHMGGKDLSDQVDGAKLLVDNYGINPKNIGIYGGSYGGFITLMALFTEPTVFAAGGALRSVTDWAHYNHGYTSNILNEPFNDPKAYERSSPINFADGLQGHLLMCHGMVDVNVHFQDIVRLNQRLIELGKNNWELAVYPVEDHGFVEPSSWTDEYKRILKLFEERLVN